MVSKHLRHVCIHRSIQFCILSTVPSGPPLNLTISVTPRTMLLFWSPPHAADRNGIITNYTVTCSLVNDIIQRTTTRETRLTVTGLEPFTNYTCSVSAATVVGSGPALVKSVVTGKGKTLQFILILMLQI